MKTARRSRCKSVTTVGIAVIVETAVIAETVVIVANAANVAIDRLKKGR